MPGNRVISRISLFLPALLGATVAVAGPAWAATCTTSAANGSCGPYSSSQIYEGSNGFTDVLNNVWNPIPGWQQTLTATDGSNWSVSANMPNGNTAVVSYPDTQTVYTTANNTPDPLSDFGSSLTSSYSQTDPAGSGNDYEWAYDIWSGTGSNNGAQETMVWTDNHGQRPAGSEISSSVSIGSQSYQLWSTSGAGQPGNPVTLVRNSQSSSGTEDLLADFNWLLANGYWPQGTGINQIDYGPELCSTGGVTETFALSSFTTLSGTGTQQAPAATTNAASGVTSSGATLNGTVNPEGAATTYQFQYGTTTAYGTNVPSPAGSAGSGTTAVSESAGITGLAPSTTYHYRITATNSAGTSNGADQTFTTSAAGGGGTVTYAATGPGSAGKTCGNCSSLSWSFTQPSGSDPAVLVGVSVGSNSSQTVTVTDNGTAMAAKTGKLNTDNQSAGFLQVFGLTGIPAGTNTIVVTVSGLQPVSVTGGSESFTGVSQSATYGTVVTAFGSGTLAKASTVGSFSGDMVTGFAANGSPINSAASPATSRFIANHDNSTGAGNSAGATSAATGSGVTISWNVVSDWWAVALVPLHHD